MGKKKKVEPTDLKEKPLFSGRLVQDDKIILNMTFEEAMKKALNTPLPSKKNK